MFKQLLLAGVVVANSAAYVGGSFNVSGNNAVIKGEHDSFKNVTANANASGIYLVCAGPVQAGVKLTVGYTAGVMQTNSSDDTTLADRSNWRFGLKGVVVADVAGQTAKFELGYGANINSKKPWSVEAKDMHKGPVFSVAVAARKTDASTLFVGVETQFSNKTWTSPAIGLVVEFYKNM